MSKPNAVRSMDKVSIDISIQIFDKIGLEIFNNVSEEGLYFHKNTVFFDAPRTGKIEVEAN